MQLGKVINGTYKIICIQFKCEPGCLNAWGAMDCMGENWLKSCFHYYNTHVKQYAGTLFDCTTGVVSIQMAPINKTNIKCACVHT